MNLKKLYKAAKDTYYNSTPILTDARFDALEDHLRKLYPNWKELKKTGTKPTKQEVKLPVPMPSLDKLYPDDKKLKKFLAASNDLLAVDKLDGASVLLTYKGGMPVSLTTRGDGEVGKDISHLLHALTLPKRIKPKGTLYFRCEAVMRKSTFENFYTDKFDNPRNLVNGLLNRKEPTEDLKNVDIVVLAVYGQPYYKSLKTAVLLGFNTVQTSHLSELPSLLADRKNKCKYEVDGLVLIERNQVFRYENAKRPKWTYAFKQNQPAVRATVTRIEWIVQPSGRIIPRAHIKPISLGGTTITKLAAHNAAQVLSTNLGKGSIIEIVKAGDVIPKIVSVVKKGEVTLPEIPHKREGAHFVTKHKVSNEPKRIATFLKALGVKGLAAKSLQDSNLTLESFLEAYAATKLEAKLNKLIGATNALKVSKSCNKAFGQKLNASLVIGASGVVDGLGVRKFEELAALGVLKPMRKRAIKFPDEVSQVTRTKITKNSTKLLNFVEIMQKTLKIDWNM